MNTSIVCASAQIRPGKEISSPRKPSGCPDPSQCSSREWIASAGNVGKPESPCDFRPSFTANLNQLATGLFGAEGHPDDL